MVIWLPLALNEQLLTDLAASRMLVLHRRFMTTATTLRALRAQPARRLKCLRISQLLRH